MVVASPMSLTPCSLSLANEQNRSAISALSLEYSVPLDTISPSAQCSAREAVYPTILCLWHFCDCHEYKGQLNFWLFLQLRLNKVSELIHNSTHHQDLEMAKVSVFFQEIIDTVSEPISTSKSTQCLIKRFLFSAQTEIETSAANSIVEHEAYQFDYA